MIIPCNIPSSILYAYFWTSNDQEFVNARINIILFWLFFIHFHFAPFTIRIIKHQSFFAILFAHLSCLWKFWTTTTTTNMLFQMIRFRRSGFLSILHSLRQIVHWNRLKKKNERKQQYGNVMRLIKKQIEFCFEFNLSTGRYNIHFLSNTSENWVFSFLFISSRAMIWFYAVSCLKQYVSLLLFCFFCSRFDRHVCELCMWLQYNSRYFALQNVLLFEICSQTLNSFNIFFAVIMFVCAKHIRSWICSPLRFVHFRFEHFSWKIHF